MGTAFSSSWRSLAIFSLTWSAWPLVRALVDDRVQVKEVQSSNQLHSRVANDPPMMVVWIS
jgi:hypothetical protein